MIKKLIIVIPIVLALVISNLLADSTTTWRLSGMMDANASYTINSTPTNVFGVELALVDITYTTENIRATVALHEGNYVDRNYSQATPIPTVFNVLHQAYAGLRLFNNVWFDIGILPSHIGYEGAKSSDNLTYTRSLMAETGMYFETGARLSGTGEIVSVQLLATNGWHNIYDNDGKTAFGTLIVVKPTSQWKFGLSSYYGNASATNGYLAYRSFADVYAEYNNSNVTVAVTANIGKQQLAREIQQDTIPTTYYGSTVQAKYHIDTMFAVNARIETFWDPDNVVLVGSNGNPYNVVGGSVGLDIVPKQYVQLRLEAKVLRATRDIFAIDNGAFKSTQMWFTLAYVVSIF